MKGNLTPLRRMALALTGMAAGLLPSTRADWARAMRTELHYINRDSEALAWAFSCVAGAITMRLETMITGNLKVSRWVLAPELLLCFAPLTLAWYDGMFGMSGIIRLNPVIIEQYFLNTATGTIMLTIMFALAVLGVFGPVGLLQGLRTLAPGSRAPGKHYMYSLAAAPVLLGCINIAGWLLTDTTLRFDHWAYLILVSILPFLGATHLYLYSYSGVGNLAVK
jgi:hypothetical protein